MSKRLLHPKLRTLHKSQPGRPFHSQGSKRLFQKSRKYMHVALVVMFDQPGAMIRTGKGACLFISIQVVLLGLQGSMKLTQAHCRPQTVTCGRRKAQLCGSFESDREHRGNGTSRSVRTLSKQIYSYFLTAVVS